MSDDWKPKHHKHDKPAPEPDPAKPAPDDKSDSAVHKEALKKHAEEDFEARKARRAEDIENPRPADKPLSPSPDPYAEPPEDPGIGEP